jgi:uncharacterized membrane protein YeaQ/YmgE (transglycosylase-associated protein family)
MPEVDLATSIHQWANDILVWIGFGTIVGLAAKAIMPGRDPGGAIATTLMGIGGTVLGCGAMALIFDGRRVTPLSPLGFAAATAGAFIILAFYKVLAGYWFVEGEVPLRTRTRSPYYRRRYRNYAVVDDE